MRQGLRPWNPTAPFLCYRNKRAKILFHINDAPRTTITSLALRGKNSPLNILFSIIYFSPKVWKISVFWFIFFRGFWKFSTTDSLCFLQIIIRVNALHSTVRAIYAHRVLSLVYAISESEPCEALRGRQRVFQAETAWRSFCAILWSVPKNRIKK